MMGHTGLPAYTGREALEVVEKKRPALILLDISLPDMNGFEVMKETEDIPVICVTARDEIPDRVKGLMTGAEDYIVKPFALEELSARIQVVLRREQREQTLYTLGGTEVDIRRSSVKRDGEPVELTHREYTLLKVLLENRNIALSRSQILDLAWGLDYYGDDRTVDVHIRRLRQKLGLEEQIKTIFKYGYRLEM